MKAYQGPLWASHNNCRALVDHTRQFSDEQFIELIKRDAVIGVALDAWMMVPNWVRGKSTPEAMGVTLETMARSYRPYLSTGRERFTCGNRNRSRWRIWKGAKSG